MKTAAAVPGLLAALCLLLPVLADDCAPYVDSDFRFHQGQTCVLSFCAGTCTNRYCSIIPGTALDQSQILCLVNNLYVIIGTSSVISLIIIAGVVACCCKSLCLCCSLCFPQRRTPHLSASVAVTNVRPLMVMPSTSGYRPLATDSVLYDHTGKGYLPPPYPGEVHAGLSYPAK